MKSSKEVRSSSPELPDEAYSKAMSTRVTRAMDYYEHVKRLYSLTPSPDSESPSDLSQELHRLGIHLHSRSNSKESQFSARTSFSLKDISNSKDFAPVHRRRTSSKLLTFEDSSDENSRLSSDPAYKSSVLVKSANQSYSHLLGSVSRPEDNSRLQESVKEGSLALISEFPSSVDEEAEPGRDTSRTNVLDVDLRSPIREGSTILTNLSSDSSHLVYSAYSEADHSLSRVLPSGSLPSEQLEINLFDPQPTSQVTEMRCSVSCHLPPPRKLYCPSCQTEVVPILSFQPADISWCDLDRWKRIFLIGEMVKCCREAKPIQEDVVHICRKCSRELHRSQAR